MLFTIDSAIPQLALKPSQWIGMLITILLFTSCSGQLSTGTTDENRGGPHKLVRNHFIPQFSEEYFFVQCGLQDQEGNLWFGTAGNGIYVYDGDSFLNFTHQSYLNFIIRDDLNHNDILCCFGDKSGNIWFGTRRGLIRFTPSGGKPEAKDFSLYLIPANTITKASRTRLPYTLQSGDNFVWSIMQDQSGTLWFGTGRGIYIHNPSADTDEQGPLFRRFLDSDSLLNPGNLQLMDVSVMHQDKKGNIWFASAWNKGEGLVRFDGKSLLAFTPDGVKSFRCIAEQIDGSLLCLSPVNGLYTWDGNTFSSLNAQLSIPQDTLVSMLSDSQGNLWLGHSSSNIQDRGDGGLHCYDGKTWKLFTTADGLPHNHVFCIIPDRAGNIWFGTRNTGLCRYDGKSFVNFTE